MVDPLTCLENCRVEKTEFLSRFNTSVDVLRLDLLHPVISGNKWFKLKMYLREALFQNKKTLLTFGGAYSNHIVATAAAAKQNGLKSIGIIRGEKPLVLSHTLRNAISFGMELHYVSREAYRRKTIPAEVFANEKAEDIFLVNEGGYGSAGAEGAKEILQMVRKTEYTHIMVAVGTGTTLAGLIAAADASQKLIGISVMKNNFELQRQVQDLIPPEKVHTFELLHDYHFGGYAKYNAGLIDFMNDLYGHTGIPSDFVYTGKLFFAAQDLLKKNYFTENSRVLVIHSGGLQGNLSLAKGTLIF